MSGPVRADGSIEASRIECKAVAGELEVTGLVSNLDSMAMTFQINALVVDYGAAVLDNFPSAGVINEGDPVVRLTQIDPLDLDDHSQRAILYSVVNALDLRANTAFRYYETGSPVEYELVRLLHTTMRQLEVER